MGCASCFSGSRIAQIRRENRGDAVTDSSVRQGGGFPMLSVVCSWEVVKSALRSLQHSVLHPKFRSCCEGREEAFNCK